MSVSVLSAKEICESSYDVFFSSFGYESRSIYFPERFDINSTVKISVGFDFNQSLSYKRAKSFYEGKGWFVEELSDSDFSEFILGSLNRYKPKKILMDISCFSRLRISKLLNAFRIFSKSDNSDLTVDLVYSVAEYTEPPKDFPPITNVGPVIPDFAGWPGDSSKPISCLIGLGYDEGRALGAAEYLEAAELWLFRPVGYDDRFLSSLNEANQSLIESINPHQVIDYRLDDPVMAYMKIHSLLWGLRTDSRPILLPFGPKIFTAIACAAAINFQPDVSVWRVSSSSLELPVDRRASGNFSSVRFKFHP